MNLVKYYLISGLFLSICFVKTTITTSSQQQLPAIGIFIATDFTKTNVGFVLPIFNRIQLEATKKFGYQNTLPDNHFGVKIKPIKSTHLADKVINPLLADSFQQIVDRTQEFALGPSHHDIFLLRNTLLNTEPYWQGLINTENLNAKQRETILEVLETINQIKQYKNK